jgi:hypothetical protein
MLKVVKYGQHDRILGYPEECGFGDIWAVTSYLLRISEETGRPTRFFTKSKSFKSTIQSILPVLRSKGKIEFIGGHAAQRILNYCEPYKLRFIPTVRTWEINNSKIIAYQFDGSHLSKHKNINGSRLTWLLNNLIKMGYKPVDIGGKKSINFIVDTLAEAKLFLGCPSGLSVAALSVGTPIFLITKMLKVDFVRFLRSCQYHTKPVRMFRTANQFLFCLNRE